MAFSYSVLTQPTEAEATLEEGGNGRERDHHLLPPVHVGGEARYVIQGMSASGGDVLPTYRAVSSSDGKKVLLRVFIPECKLSRSEEADLLEKMKKVFGSLNSSVVPSFVDCFADDTPEGPRRIFIVHEEPPGESLEELVAKGWLFSEEEVVGIAVETLQVLPYLDQHRKRLNRISEKLLNARSPRQQEWEIESLISQSNICSGNIIVDVERARVGGLSWVGHVKLLPGLGVPWTAGPPRGASAVTWQAAGNNTCDVARSPPLTSADPQLERQRAIAQSDFFALGLTAVHVATGEPPSLTIRDLQFRNRVRLRDHVQMTDRLAQTLERLLLFHYVPGSSYGFHHVNDVIHALRGSWTALPDLLPPSSTPDEPACRPGPGSRTPVSSTWRDPVSTSPSPDPDQVELLVMRGSQSSVDHGDVSKPESLPAQHRVRVNLGPTGYEPLSSLLPRTDPTKVAISTFSPRKPKGSAVVISSDGREISIDIPPSLSSREFRENVQLFLLCGAIIHPVIFPVFFLNDKRRLWWLLLFPAFHLLWGLFLLLGCDASRSMSVKMVGGGAYTIATTIPDSEPQIEAEGQVGNIREVRVRFKMSSIDGDQYVSGVEGCEVIEIGGRRQRFGESMDTVLDHGGKLWLVGEINAFLRKQR
ncbi:hypothetical protein CBR_g40047 [Chara braunii]|uniref:Protein kinase domain-containing protein n=1 Tax=Chara braunii TaxID=69332 RepID=A0A388LT15_CHABU|nr:hypothetical protein CBR_g40047 [Chara braunii]|eukprot:GBG85405.1 hypothetical protein CBR_g40047 [Chara braunii]